MSDKNDYFDYVNSVLGVKSIYVDASEGANGGVAGVKQSIPLLVAVENLSQYSADEKDLLEKMISALKIDLNKIKVCDSSLSGQTEAEFILRFSDEISQSSMTENSLTTYSPRLLLKNPSFKKQVWNEFQTVIKYFSN